MALNSSVALAVFASCFLFASTALAQDYTLPFKGEDFLDGERVYWGRAIHSDSGVQKHGYDLDVRIWRASAKDWRAFKGDGAKNSDWYVHGKPVYAMRAGTVIAC